MAYSKARLLSDVLLTLKAQRYPVKGVVVAELTEVVFACLQVAFLREGEVAIPQLGTLRVELKDRPEFTFRPHPDLERRLLAALRP